MSSAPRPRPSDDEAIQATAAAWLAERDDGLALEREAEFARWRAADPRHETAVARLERAWAALQPLREFRPEARRHPDRDLLGTQAARERKAMPFPALAAATALAACLALVAVGWWAVKRHAGPVEQRYSTTVEGYERVTLEDGSMVELNSASEVGVQFSPAERRVRLVRGEAHFTVAKNKARPFVVEAGGVAVRAVGTAFNVRLGAREVEVLVTEGRVAVAMPEVRNPNAAAATPTTTPATVSSPEIAANQRLTIPTAAATAVGRSTPVPPPPAVERVAPEAVREALAWQGPRLVFVDTPLAEAVAQFNRRNPVQLELADRELGALPIGGSFRAENVDGFVRLLVSDGEIAADRPDATRIVLRKAK